MSRIKKIALAIVFLVVFFFVVADAMYKWATESVMDVLEINQCIDNANSIKNDDYAGLVVHKYIDREKRAGKVLVVDIGLEQSKPVLFNGKIGDAYSQIIVGDSIVKELGVLSIERWRKGKLTTLDFVIDCE
ncbi:MAG: hypothetical protein ACI85F_001494 [Bacteroidia bacterium]|jgi:hypothetical protein